LFPKSIFPNVSLFVRVTCQYQSSRLPRKTRLQNDQLHVEWDVNPT